MKWTTGVWWLCSHVDELPSLEPRHFNLVSEAPVNSTLCNLTNCIVEVQAPNQLPWIELWQTRNHRHGSLSKTLGLQPKHHLPTNPLLPSTCQAHHHNSLLFHLKNIARLRPSVFLLVVNSHPQIHYFQTGVTSLVHPPESSRNSNICFGFFFISVCLATHCFLFKKRSKSKYVTNQQVVVHSAFWLLLVFYHLSKMECYSPFSQFSIYQFEKYLFLSAA